MPLLTPQVSGQHKSMAPSRGGIFLAQILAPYRTVIVQKRGEKETGGRNLEAELRIHCAASRGILVPGDADEAAGREIRWEGREEAG